MLSEEIKKIKKECPGLLVTERGGGGCKFCGQIRGIEVPADWDEDMCNELATEFCDCVEAENYTRGKKRKEKAAEAIENQFGRAAGGDRVEDSVKQLLLQIVDMAIEEKINSGTIDIGGGVKAKITVTTKGPVKVERIKTEKKAQEA